MNILLNIFTIVFWGAVLYFLVLRHILKPKVIQKLKDIWNLGIQTRIQRLGFLLLVVGILSLVAWLYEDIYDWSYLFSLYELPSEDEVWFYRLHVYLIPIGLLMTWLIPLPLKIKDWILTGK